MKRINVIILMTILVVSCLFLSSCFTTMFTLDSESEDSTSEVPTILEHSQLTRDETLQALSSVEALISGNKSSFDSLGYDISSEDAEIYALASIVNGEPVNGYKMLSYLGYSISKGEMQKAEYYSKGKALIQEGSYKDALRLFYASKDLLDSQDYYAEILTSNLVSFHVLDEGLAGGIVFYDKGYFSDGWRYLEAAPTDLSYTNSSGTTTKYYPFGYYRTSSSGSNSIVGTKTAIGTGKANTEALVKAMGETAYTRYSGTSKGIYAAKACADYSITVDGVVYDDWFLPSKDELNLMYKKLHKQGLGSFANDYYYWSSSEYSYGTAWKQGFSFGSQYDYFRNYYYYVRPVRAF